MQNDQPTRSTEMVFSDKLYTLKQDLWLPIYTNIQIIHPYIGRMNWWGIVNFPEAEYPWWVFGKQGCRWNHASTYPDYDWMAGPSFKHDTLLWGIRYGAIAENQNNAIDKELGEEVRQEAMAWKPITAFRAWRVETGTLLHNEQFDPDKPLHGEKRLKI